MAKINLIFRSKKRNEYSIESVFYSLIPILEKEGYEVECSYLPCERYNDINTLKENICFVKSLQGDIFHITGEVNFVIPFIKGKTVLTLHDFVRMTQLSGIKKKIYELFFLKWP